MTTSSEYNQGPGPAEPLSAREQTDADLIRGGARLILTEEQVAAIHQGCGVTPTNDPPKVLRLWTRTDGLEDALRTPMDELVQASENDRVFTEQFKATTGLYTRLVLKLGAAC